MISTRRPAVKVPRTAAHRRDGDHTSRARQSRMTATRGPGTLVVMDTPGSPVRAARPGDIEQLLSLWGSLFDEERPLLGPWAEHARRWVAETVHDRGTTLFPLVESDGVIVAGPAAPIGDRLT